MRFSGLQIRACSFLCGVALLLGTLPPLMGRMLFAQESPEQPAADSVRILSEILQEKRSTRASMMRMLDALNVVDSAYKVHYPTWIVLDEDLRQRVMRMFRFRFPDFTHTTDLIVVTNPE
jgi:hypothetical protein